jgi:hypothetical protein
MLKRFYHPGFELSKRICLPYCPPDIKNIYYNHVWGNKVQEVQQINDNSYQTNHINYYSNQISRFYDFNTLPIPTSHNTPIETALRSLRKINADKFIKHIDSDIIDDDGVFIDTSNNRTKLYRLINQCNSIAETTIMEYAIFGIYSNFADSIYIANDYLSVDNDKVIIANYPDQVAGREIERCRIAAYNLLYGNYPIILDSHINFEGEANIKYIPAIIEEDGQKYQLCFGYDSSRSCTKAIDNINKYMEKMNLPLLREICIYPEKGMETFFYHFDCIINFYTNNEIQYFESVADFWHNYERNGAVVVEMNGIGDKKEIARILDHIFDDIIEVSKEDDLLCANMIMNREGIVGSLKLSNICDLEKLNETFLFAHPSTGGGGAHKCCSNVLNRNSPISIDQWIDFMREYDINASENFIIGVKNEMDRLTKIMSNRPFIQ